jgi:hypothetical protein
MNDDAASRSGVGSYKRASKVAPRGFSFDTLSVEEIRKSSQRKVSAVLIGKESWRAEMNAVVGSNHVRSKAAASLGTACSDGGNVDEILKRLGALEIQVAEIRAVLPTLATKEEVQAVRTHVETVRTEVQATRAELKGDILSVETRMIRWFIGTAVAIAAAAFAAAKLVN